MDIKDILLFTSGLFLNAFFLKFYKQLNNNNIKISKKKAILIVLSMTIIEIMSNFFLKKPYSFILSFAIIAAVSFILSSKLKESLILTIVFEINIIISEMIIIIIVSMLFKSYDSIPVIIFSDFTIPIVGLLLLKTKIPQKVYKFIIDSTKIINNKEIVIYVITVIVIMTISTMESYMRLAVPIVLITNTIVSIVLIMIVTIFITTKNNYNLVTEKYQTSIKSLKEYETMIDKFRVNSHENKNEILTIRNMIKNKDKKIIEYIDKLVDNKIRDNEKIMLKTSKIPEGGLRATIYSKLCQMEHHKIKYNLEISNDVRTVDLINLDEELVLNICKILGVFLDNAIEAVKTIKEKTINIELYTSGNSLYVDISNKFSGKLDLDKIGKERVTTKGKNHGYGLLLVNKIINENNKYLENEKRVDSNLFTQTLIIKM